MSDEPKCMRFDEAVSAFTAIVAAGEAAGWDLTENREVLNEARQAAFELRLAAGGAATLVNIAGRRINKLEACLRDVREHLDAYTHDLGGEHGPNRATELCADIDALNLPKPARVVGDHAAEPARA